jgi:putative DNA primase/helicase
MIDVNTATNAELDAEIFRLDRGQVTGIDFERFLALEIPPRRCLLAPWLPQQGLAMIHAPRGIGKTHIALGTAWAVATGTGFLKWKVPDDVGARRVVVLDGEMPAVVLQERLRAITADCRHTPPLPD